MGAQGLVEKKIRILLQPFIGQPNIEATRLKTESLLIKYFDNHTPKFFRVERRK